MPRVEMPALQRRHKAITLRSVLLGLAGILIICGLTPYNDYVLNNSFLVGNNLPLGVLMLTFLFILLVNGPLNKWLPNYVFSSGELTVAFSMTLVSCALPSSGLMRYFPASLIMPMWHAQGNSEFRGLLEKMNLPRWIFPDFKGKTPSEWTNDPIVTGYHFRWTEDTLPPYLAWLTPAISWGIFIFALYGAMLCLVTIVRRQWFENERLPFPLAQIQLTLVEQPSPGKFFNSFLRQRSFWIAFGAIFCLHLWNGLNKYFPRHFEPIPVFYDLTNLFSEPPFRYTLTAMQKAAVFFTVVGVTYFLSAPVAFSLWFFFVLHNVARMILGTTTGDANITGLDDQRTGAILAFLLVTIWVGRAHWLLVIRQAFRGHRDGEPRGRYLSYPAAFWLLMFCLLTMVGWLTAAGCSVGGAATMVLVLVSLFMVSTRLIAETGLVHGPALVGIYKPFQFAAMEGWQLPVSVKTFYFGALLQSQHYDFREIVPVYASHGMKIADTTIFGDSHDASEPDRRAGRRLVGLMFFALFVGYVVSFSSTLWTEYNYASTKDITQTTPINTWGADGNQMWLIVDPTNNYAKSNYHPQHSPGGNFAFGILFTIALAVLRLRYTWWPLHPVGYILQGTFPGDTLWFSIFLGWLVKSLVVRFGGARLYSNAKPFFLGMIVGESVAAGFWLIVGIVLSSMNMPYRTVNIMPG